MELIKELDRERVRRSLEKKRESIKGVKGKDEVLKKLDEALRSRDGLGLRRYLVKSAALRISQTEVFRRSLRSTQAWLLLTMELSSSTCLFVGGFILGVLGICSWINKQTERISGGNSLNSYMMRTKLWRYWVGNSLSSTLLWRMRALS